MYAGLLEIICVHYQRQDLLLGQTDMFFQDRIVLIYHPIWGDWACMYGACGGEEGTDGSSVGCGRWLWRQTAGKQRHGRALASRRLAHPKTSPPKGGELDTTGEEDNHNFLSGAVWRRRSYGSSAAGKPCMEAFGKKRPYPTLREVGAPIRHFPQPLPSSVPTAHIGVPRALC
jgi:hypothetical protein